MVQNKANLCVRCEARFDRWAEYHQHVTVNTCARLIKPINISGRSKAQIVSDWETDNKGVII